MLVLGAAPSPSASPTTDRFEGIVDLKLTMEAGDGDLSLSLAGDMAKLDMKIRVGGLPEPIPMSVLLDAKSPKTATLLSDRTKSFSILNLPEAKHSEEEFKGAGKFKVKVHGQEKLLGFLCSHVTLQRDGEMIDAWITKEMPDVYQVLKKLQEANPQIGEPELFQALEAAGHAGLPMRCIVIRDGQRVTTEVKKVERRALAPAVFVIPKDYVRSEGAAKSLKGYTEGQ
jgi:Domain of unknown function (DUF4412)